MDSIDIGLYLSAILLVVATASAVVLPLLNAIKHPAGLIKSLLGVGGLVVLFIVAYSLSGSELSAKAVALGVDESGSKLIGAGLILLYFVFVISILGLIYSEISKALK
jgi:hypothetical protein